MLVRLVFVDLEARYGPPWPDLDDLDPEGTHGVVALVHGGGDCGGFDHGLLLIRRRRNRT